MLKYDDSEIIVLSITRDQKHQGDRGLPPTSHRRSHFLKWQRLPRTAGSTGVVRAGREVSSVAKNKARRRKKGRADAPDVYTTLRIEIYMALPMALALAKLIHDLCS